MRWWALLISALRWHISALVVGRRGTSGRRRILLVALLLLLWLLWLLVLLGIGI